ncbi:MAG TPA: hypothetical protein VI365_08835 [Trebonia sp.]
MIDEGGQAATTAGWVSRRTFAGGSVALALLSAIPVSLGRVAAAAGSPWARSRFTPFLGSTFRMTGAGDDADVVLTEISDLRPAARANDNQRFALLFTAAHGHGPADGTRTFTRAGFGAIDLFVSPVGAGAEARHYEAIINRL